MAPGSGVAPVGGVPGPAMVASETRWTALYVSEGWARHGAATLPHRPSASRAALVNRAVTLMVLNRFSTAGSRLHTGFRVRLCAAQWLRGRIPYPLEG